MTPHHMIHTLAVFKSRNICIYNTVLVFYHIFFYKEDLLTYKNLQKYATKYIHLYNMKYNKMAAYCRKTLFSMKEIKCKLFS